jgi:hypothetical protein
MLGGSMSGEEWRDVVGYENEYIVNNKRWKHVNG